MIDKYTFRGLAQNPTGDLKYEWVYGYHVAYTDFSVIFPHDGSSFRRVNPETVGLWSTFRDKNDHPIFHGDIIQNRVPARDSQTHTGPNIPMGVHIEPLEPIIIDELYAVEYQNGMFHITKDKEGKWPLSWNTFEWDIESAMSEFSNGIGYENQTRWTWDSEEDESDLPYLLSEYGFWNAQDLVESLGIEVVADVYTDERYKDWI